MCGFAPSGFIINKAELQRYGTRMLFFYIDGGDKNKIFRRLQITLIKSVNLFIVIPKILLTNFHTRTASWAPSHSTLA